MLTSIVAGIAVLIAVTGLYIGRSIKRGELRGMQERESLSDAEIYRRFYAAFNLSEDKVIELWHEVAATLRVPADKLRPEDRFGRDIGVPWITSEDIDQLSELARRRAKKTGATIDLKAVQSVDDYIRAFGSVG